MKVLINTWNIVLCPGCGLIDHPQDQVLNTAVLLCIRIEKGDAIRGWRTKDVRCGVSTHSTRYPTLVTAAEALTVDRNAEGFKSYVVKYLVSCTRYHIFVYMFGYKMRPARNKMSNENVTSL